jgi:hypothetical protein
MKKIVPTLFALLILTSCNKESNQKERLDSEISALEGEQVKKKQEINEDVEEKLDVLTIKNLILNSDSVYLYIGESQPGKVPLPISEKLTKREDIERFVGFIPNDTATLPTKASLDTVFIPNPPPPRWGNSIGALKIYRGSLNTVWIDIGIDTSDTFFYLNYNQREKAFTKEGHTYFSRKYREYKSLQQNL